MTLCGAACTLVLDLPSDPDSTGDPASASSGPSRDADATDDAGTSVTSESDTHTTSTTVVEEVSTSAAAEAAGGPASSSDDATTTAVDTSTSDAASTGEAAGRPNGSPCDLDVECASSACYIMGPLGGFCGQCLVDADCPDGGCSIPEVVIEPVEGAVCNVGEVGGGCQSDAACAPGLECELIFDLPGVVENSTCGECTVDADCEDLERCTPSYDYPALGGAWRCVAVGSVPNGGGCDLFGDDAACASGHCAPAELLGVVAHGVCGECETDDDCGAGDCAAASIALNVGATPSACV